MRSFRRGCEVCGRALLHAVLGAGVRCPVVPFRWHAGSVRGSLPHARHFTASLDRSDGCENVESGLPVRMISESMRGGARRMSYEIRLVSPADEALDVIPESSFREVDNAIRSLSSLPEPGRVYGPLYGAARIPDDELSVLYVRNYGIYYTVDHGRAFVRIRFIEDQRMDPRMRF